MSISLVETNFEDLDDIIFFEEKSFSKYYRSKKDRDLAIDYFNESKIYFIVSEGERVGTISYADKGDEAYISGLTVLPEHRGKKIGALAMDELLSFLEDFEKITLTVHPKNVPALIIYLKKGFEIRDWKDDCYGDGEPRIYLEK